MSDAEKSPARKAASKPAGVSTAAVVREALASSEDRKGMSLAGIKSFAVKTYPEVAELNGFKSRVKKAVLKMLETEDIVRSAASKESVGVTGRFKLVKKTKKAAAKPAARARSASPAKTADKAKKPRARSKSPAAGKAKALSKSKSPAKKKASPKAAAPKKAAAKKSPAKPKAKKSPVAAKKSPAKKPKAAAKSPAKAKKPAAKKAAKKA